MSSVNSSSETLHPLSFNAGPDSTASDYSNPDIQKAFLHLPKADQEALIWIHQRQANILNSATLFGLTLDEKQSIEKDITAQKPIGVGESTLAYEKFLKHIFPGKSVTFPYLADYADAVKIVGELSKLFEKTVKLPSKEQAIESLKGNKHFTGYRDAMSGEIMENAEHGYAWIFGEILFDNAFYFWHNRNGDSYHGWFSPLYGRSVIPVFG